MSASGKDRSESASGVARFAWGVVALNLAVVLWGALVRATGSGAGCGSHWPLCNGEILPEVREAATLIEFVHRAMSGVALLAVAGLWGWATRVYPRSVAARRWASVSLLLILLEAAIGAGLVLFGWVAEDTSLGRAISVPLHLGVTFALLASLTLVAWSAVPRGEGRGNGAPVSASLAAVLLGGMVLVGMTGALTALGDTLFPAASIPAGIAMDLDAGQHFMVRLRVVHPVLAVVLAGSVFLWAELRLRADPVSSGHRLRLRILRGLMVVQTAGGVVNVLLLAPVWMQLIHLALADVAWIALVVVVWESRGPVPRDRQPWGDQPAGVPSSESKMAR